MRRKIEKNQIKRKLGLSFIFWMIGVYIVYAQSFSISGKVVDRSNNAPLGSVSVKVEGTTMVATTDKKGVFLLDGLDKKTYKLSFSYMGYGEVVKDIEAGTQNIVLPLTYNAIQLDELQVVRNKNHSISVGALDASDLSEIPFSAQVISASDISDKGAHTLLQAVQGATPMYTIQLPSNDGRGDAEPQARGLDVNFIQDGLPIGSTIRPEVELMDKIEMLDGPTSAFYGFSGTSLGGTVNYRLKQPLDTTYAKLGLGQYYGSVNYLSADLGGAIDKDKKLTSRFMAYREKGEGYVRGSNIQRQFVYAALNYKPIDAVTFKTSASHHEFDYEGQQILFKIDPTKYSIPDASKYDLNQLYGQSWTFTRGSQDQGLLGFESKLGPVHLDAQGQIAHTTRQSRTLSGQIIDNSGDYTETYSDAGPSEAWNNTANAKLWSKFNTGILKHNLAVGYVYLYNLQKSNSNASKTSVIDTCSILHPSTISSPELFADYNKYKRTKAINNTISLQDQINVGQILNLVLGIGYAQVSSRTDITSTGASSNVYNQHGFTPAIGLMIKPYSWLHPYASWSRGIVNGGMTTTTYAKNVNEYLSPSYNDQFEAGIKSTVLATPIFSLNLSACYYHINKINEYLDPADSVYKQDGREIHQGIELNAEGSVFTNLKYKGCYTWIDATVKKAKNNTSIEDKTPANIPDYQARFQLEYLLPGTKGLYINAAGNWVGKRYVDAANTASIPSVATYDAGVRYETLFVKHKTTLQVNVTNLTNKKYWATYKPTGTVGLGLGEPRLVSVGAQIEL